MKTIQHARKRVRTRVGRHHSGPQDHPCLDWAHGQVGHLFQGRFKAVVIQEVRGGCEVARYVPLNPVRVQGLGLGKAEQRRAKVLGCEDPGAALVARRLQALAADPSRQQFVSRLRRRLTGPVPAGGWRGA